MDSLNHLESKTIWNLWWAVIHVCYNWHLTISTIKCLMKILEIHLWVSQKSPSMRHLIPGLGSPLINSPQEDKSKGEFEPDQWVPLPHSWVSWTRGQCGKANAINHKRGWFIFRTHQYGDFWDGFMIGFYYMFYYIIGTSWIDYM